MTDLDAEKFFELWGAVQEQYGRRPGPAAQNVAFEALRQHALPDISQALSAHVRDPERGQFPPKPADVIARLLPNAHDDGRPGPEEAWSIAPRDEATTVVMTDEIATAWGAALPLLESGDQVAARMAFREVYNREVEAARQAAKPVRWFASMGDDVAGRAPALKEAVRRGRLTYARAVALLPKLADEPIDTAGQKQLQTVRTLLLTAMPNAESSDDQAA